MSELKPRPYQEDALNQIRRLYQTGTKKVLLHLSTGGGKTFIFSKVLKGSHQRGFHAIMLVRGRKLVDQASQRLEREGVPHGVMMASHKKYNPEHQIQICSIDTMRSRGLRPTASLIVIDEAHLATSKSFKDLISDYPDAFLLPVTATPYTDKSLRHLADKVVKPITTQKLIDQGYLVDARYFCMTIPDTSKIKTTKTKDGKDFNQSELSELMEDELRSADIASEWLGKAKGRPTIAFCVTVNHSKMLTEYLISRGIKAEHLDASSTDEERDNAIKRLESGDTEIICNVGILCVGVDIPSLGCIIMARPTKSLNLYIQQAGRGTRPFKGKKDFIILDHAANVLRHGFITDEKDANLDEDKGPRKANPEPGPKQCEECFCIYKGSICPECGNENEKTTKEWEITGDGTLKEYKKETIDPLDKFIKDMKEIRRKNNYKHGWVYWRVVEKFGEDVAKQKFKKRTVPHWVTRRA